MLSDTTKNPKLFDPIFDEIIEMFLVYIFFLFLIEYFFIKKNK